MSQPPRSSLTILARAGCPEDNYVDSSSAVDRGAIAGKGATRHTDFLVTGYQDLCKLAQGANKSAKLERAEALRSGDQQIEIITESDFVQLLSKDAADGSSGHRVTAAESQAT